MPRAGLPVIASGLAVIATLVAGCQSTAHVAPIVAPRDALVQQGRQLYLGACTKCHAPLAVRKYTQSAWEPILVDMAKETNLTPDQDRAVRAYITAVLQSPAPM